MYKICFVICYMGGKFPDYFDKFLLSCKYNPTVDWLFVTDTIPDDKIPQNVKILHMSMEELREKTKKALNADAKIDSPRSLCNYKVMYGKIFEKELASYDFWGYCDCDLIFGNIRKFVTDEILDSYDKTGICGHMTLMKNDEFHRSIWREVREAFKGYLGVDILDAGDTGWSFDEAAGINRYFAEHNLTQYGERIFESAAFDKPGFIPDYRTNNEHGFKRRIANRKNCVPWRIRKHNILFFDRGAMYRICLMHGQLTKEEICYAHFPGGRKLKNRELGDTFYIIPDEFTNDVELTPEWLKKHSEEEHLSYFIKHKFIWYRGVFSKKFPALANMVKKVAHYE